MNQSNSLKEFAQITPRLNNFVVELRQEKIFRGNSVGLKNPELDLFTGAHSVRPTTDLHATFSREDFKVEKGPKKVNLRPAQNGPSEKSVYGPPQFFAGDRTTENNRSIFATAELVYESNNKTLKFDSATFERPRANSAGQLNHPPFPRIKCVRDISSAFQDY